MTEQEIKERALKAYPISLETRTYSEGIIETTETLDINLQQRNAYIKALREVNQLPKIKGWLAKDEDADIDLYINKPKRAGEMWVGQTYPIHLDWETLFPELTWESEPLEIELTVGRV